MGLFTAIFDGNKESSKEEEKKIPWIPLTIMDQLDEIAKKSKTKTQVIFKHSTRCGISRMVIRMFINDFDLTEKQLDIYYLDLLKYRDISNETGYKFQVIHQSPQLLVIKNGIAVAYKSHNSITEVNLKQYI